jgi:hypothetical protein
VTPEEMDFGRGRLRDASSDRRTASFAGTSTSARSYYNQSSRLGLASWRAAHVVLDYHIIIIMERELNAALEAQARADTDVVADENGSRGAPQKLTTRVWWQTHDTPINFFISRERDLCAEW